MFFFKYEFFWKWKMSKYDDFEIWQFFMPYEIILAKPTLLCNADLLFY